MADLQNQNIVNRNVDEIQLNTKKREIQQENPELSGAEVHALALALVEDRIGAEMGMNNEYYNMMEDAEKIIKEFSDGEITNSDLDHYNDFSKRLYEREVELNISINLLSGIEHKNPLVRERLRFLKMKYEKLIQTRQIIERATEGKRQVTERQVTERETKKALAYMMALKYIKKDKKIPRDAAVRLGIEVPQDVKEISIMKERNEKPRETNSKEAIQDRLARLRGVANNKVTKSPRREMSERRDISHAFDSKQAEMLLRKRAEYEMSM